MSSVNLPKDPFSINPSQDSSKPTGGSSAESSPVAHEDTLAAAAADGISQYSAPHEAATPILAAPQSSDISIVAAFRTLNEAILAFRNQLRASDEVDLESLGKFNALAVSQASELSNMVDDKEAAIIKLMTEQQDQLDEVNKKSNVMEELAHNQQEVIDGINKGNGQEQQEYAKLVSANDEYVANMKGIGARDLGNGQFECPTQPVDAVKQFQTFTANHQQAIAQFNEYWNGRSAEINQYNQATSDYNQKVAEYNKTIGEFINENNLAAFVNKNGIQIPQPAPAAKRDISGYQSQIGPPSQNCDSPSYERSIAQAGPSAVPKLPPFSSFDAKIFKQEMYDNAYASRIAPLDQAIKQLNVYSSFVMKSIEEMDKEFSQSSLNSKKLAQQLLPKPRVPQSTSLSGISLAMQTVGLDNANMQAVMGALLLKEAIAQSNIKEFENLNQEKKEAKIEQLTHRIILLSIGLLSNQSLQALFPSLGHLGLISNTLASLPKNSPVFAILFAVSLSNRMGENIKQGIPAEALHNFLDSIPEFAALSTEDKAKLLPSLTSSLNIGHLLVAGKLLEDSLGLQGLLAHLLPGLSPGLNPSQIISQAKREDQQGQLELQAHIKEHFIEQGYPEDKAQFFAQVGTELTQNGLLAPAITAHISEKTINFSLFEKSITAGLALSPQYSLENAHAIAQEANSRTLDNAPFLTAKQFRSALESHLRELGVKNSSAIVAAAILVPSTEQSLALVGLGLGIAPPTAPTALSLGSIVEKRALQLLVPQLGPQLAKQISEEIDATLHTLVNVMKDNLYSLHIEDDENFAKALDETFANSFKTMTPFPAFAEKVQDPAYKYILALSTIEGDAGRKGAIDIPI